MIYSELADEKGTSLKDQFIHRQAEKCISH